MNGTQAAGTSALYARADHIHPSDTSRAPLASPSFTGTPAAPTATANTSTTQIATTAYVVGQANGTAGTIAMNGTQAAGSSNLYARADHVHPIDTSRAPLASPTFTGTPSLPTGTIAVTQAADTNSTTVATTAYVVGQASSTAPVINGTATVGTSLRYARADHIHPTDTTRAPLASPALTGTPTAPTAGGGTNTTQIATTAFVQSALAGAASYTLLANIATTSGTTVTASSLNLTPYRVLFISLVDISATGGTPTLNLNGGTLGALGTSGSTAAICIQIDLNTGVGSYARGNGAFADLFGITTGSTSVSISLSSGSFDAGALQVYGVK
jgi:hypothetical protein